MPSTGEFRQFWFSVFRKRFGKRESKRVKQSVVMVGENALPWDVLRAQALKVKSYLKEDWEVS